MRFAKYAGFHEKLAEVGAEGVAEYLASKGIKYFENCERVDGDNKPSLDTREAKRLAKEGKLNIVCYTMYINLWRGDREAIVRDAKYNLDLAKELGAKYYHQTIAPGESWHADDNPTYDEIMDMVYPYLYEIVKYALDIGIMPIFEPQGMYFNGIEGLGKLIARFDKDFGEGKVNVLFDSGNSIYIGVKPLDFLKAFMPRVKHVHIKDYRIVAEDEKGWESYNDDRFMDTYAGAGVLDIAECVKYLESHGYTGCYSSEMLVRDANPDDVDDATIKWLNGILNG